MKHLLTSMLAFFAAAPAFAYITATAANKPIDVNTRTHILIVGNGTDLGNALTQAATAQAKKYQELYPNEQVYLISVNETGKDQDTAELKEFGYYNIEEKGKSFKSKDVFNEMSQFSKIASFDVFSHSVAYYGVILDGKLNRLDPLADGYDKLAKNFTSDAYAFLHGCNSGQFLAGVFSKQWGIPVAGSFTGTDFQYIYEGKGFFNDDGRAPKDASKVKINKIGYEKNIGCYTGACSRLMPDNFAYHGFWGEFTEGGLGFYKWICAGSNITSDRCFTAMARAALSYVSIKPLRDNSSIEDYKDVVLDFLCPANKRTECRAALENAVKTGNMEYDPYGGKSLQCDFKNCKAKFTCERIPLVNLLKSGSCKVENLRESNKTTTIANEYAAYLKGYKLLQAQLSK
ncbi:hypothetical protein [Bdellovibrio sp. NC01]|uniref:hypothetical protein n=1 Tax=Bdellovibrio sp. NC01 TaxID=2220073 RepID=UPI001158A909|nr:hypothetical protein [Bdellovibrio sp. NC01]QDK36805.1 hypothetical protein DOE51_03935 [Bdellovibrio sp. NC01]